jgi:hypothetical protein
MAKPVREVDFDPFPREAVFHPHFGIAGWRGIETNLHLGYV